MATNSLGAAPDTLGSFLRERRSRLRPDAADTRRRTPGLRREEVATRAGVSVTWYTWLEQGRGGAPSAEVIERLSRALELDGAGRELLFLLAQHRPPPVVAHPQRDVPASVRQVLDAMPSSPALVKTPTWDVLAWNGAAAALMSDWSAYARADRNVLRRLFGSPGIREHLPDWEANARFALSVFRMEAVRAGLSDTAAALVDELHASSADFRRLWAEADAQRHGIGTKRILHPSAGLLHFNASAFAVEGAEGLAMIVFTPATPDDLVRVEAVLAAQAA